MQIPTVFQNEMSLEVFDTHLGAQGMEIICELQHHLAPLLVQCGPSCALVIINSNEVPRVHQQKTPKWVLAQKFLIHP